MRQAEADRAAATAPTAQRDAELDGARRHLAGSERLAPRGVVSAQTYDDDRARVRGSEAAVSAAQAQVAAADAALATARSEVIGAEAELGTARATIERIEADIDDSALRTPRDGRAHYRTAEPGEVLVARGRVLNLVDLGDVYMTAADVAQFTPKTVETAEERLKLLFRIKAHSEPSCSGSTSARHHASRGLVLFLVRPPNEREGGGHAEKPT
jgi:HlyD family secretion protein